MEDRIIKNSSIMVIKDKEEKDYEYEKNKINIFFNLRKT